MCGLFGGRNVREKRCDRPPSIGRACMQQQCARVAMRLLACIALQTHTPSLPQRSRGCCSVWLTAAIVIVVYSRHARTCLRGQVSAVPGPQKVSETTHTRTPISKAFADRGGGRGGGGIRKPNIGRSVRIGSFTQPTSITLTQPTSITTTITTPIAIGALVEVAPREQQSNAYHRWPCSTYSKFTGVATEWRGQQEATLGSCYNGIMQLLIAIDS